MTNAEIHAIQVQHTPMRVQRTLPPRFKLSGQALVEATDRTGTGSNSQERLSHFPYLMRARAGHEHLRQPFCDVGFITTVAVKDLGVELTFPISGDFEVLKPTAGCD